MAHARTRQTAFLFSLLALTSACSDDSSGEKPGSVEDGDSGANDDGGGPAVGVDNLPPLPEDITLPIVFVHGFAGSAQQYQSQAMRFVANGYPEERILAFDHDGAGLDLAGYTAGVDAVIDGALEKFGVDKVYLVGHSRGTTVSSTYLGVPAQAAKVAKYVSLDGAGCGAAEGAGVPCIAPSQALLPGQAHVETATSKESFVMQYEFLVGSSPEVVDIVRQRSPIVISGRAVNFPANTGRDGATLEIWEIDPATGERTASKPVETFELGADGAFGPVTVDADKYYEKRLYSAAGTEQHFYAQRYLRSSTFVRLLSGPPDAPSRANSNITADHTNVITLRMREWYGTDDADLDGDESDVLEISTERPSESIPATNAVVPRVANGSIALHIHDDAATPQETTLEALPYFDTQPFQKGIDVYMPAAEPPDGTITFENLPRGDASAPQILRFPNWSAETHTVMVMFSDYAQD